MSKSGWQGHTLLACRRKFEVVNPIVFVVLILLAGMDCSKKASSVQENPKGFLQGKVTIAPVRPLERRDAPPVDMSRWYKGKIVLIYSEDEKTLLAKAPVDDTGRYHVSLQPGYCMVKMKLGRMQSTRDLPKRIEIKAGQTVRVNIDIDTGIR